MAIGDWVALDQGQGESAIGQIMAFKGKDVVVALGGISSTIKVNRLQKVHAPKQEKQKISSLQGIDFNDRMAQFSITLDVRGKRGEEVFVILDQYMNDALLLGSNEIKILHGKGDGILRNLIREQLKCYSQIKSFVDEHADRGGAGVTIVTFK